MSCQGYPEQHDETNSHLERIADELSRLRALKEYELLVLSTTPDYAAGEAIEIVAGSQRLSGEAKGQTLWDEDNGSR